MFFLHVTFCLFPGRLAFDLPQCQNHEKGNAKEGKRNWWGVKTETLCADFAVVRVVLFNPKVGFQVQGCLGFVQGSGFGQGLGLFRVWGSGLLGV